MPASKNYHVAWDFDGLFVEDRGIYFLQFLQEVEGWTVSRERFSIAGNWNDATGRTKPEIDDAYNRFLLSNHAPQVQPIAPAKRALHYLKGICTSHLVTSRKDAALKEASGIIEGQFGLSFASYNGGLFGLKLRAMRERDLRVLVDDNPHEAMKVVDNLEPDEHRMVVQFPSFHLGSPVIAHRNVIRLPICNEVHDMVVSNETFSLEHKSRIFEESWHQVTACIEQLARAS